MDRSHKPGQNLASLIAERLNTDLKGKPPGAKLPAARALALSYSTSYVTMLKALGILAGRGLLEARPGRGVRMLGSNEDGDRDLRAVTGRASSLYTHLRGLIMTGRYKAGDDFPKLSHFALEFRISNHTVGECYARLVSENCIHKLGRRWKVGPEKKEARDVMSSFSVLDPNPMTLLVLLADDEGWNRIYGISGRRNFAIRFEQEAENHRIRLLPVLTSVQSRHDLAGVQRAGLEEIKGLVRKMGNGYRGTLLVGGSKEIPDSEAWIARLSAFGNPIIWVDLDGAGSSVGGIPSTCCRCYGDETLVLENLLVAISEAGHRKVGFPIFSRTPWVHAIVSQSRAIIQRLGLNMEVVWDQQPHPFWENRPDTQTPSQVLRRLHKTGIPFIRKLIGNLFEKYPGILDDPGMNSVSGNPNKIIQKADAGILWSTGVLVPLLKKHPDITVLVAPKAHYGMHIHSWLKAAGADLPGDMSVVYLRHDDSNPMHISSMDPGYDYLGYAAFHLFLKDIPIIRDRSGNVAAVPKFIQRGSLARPRRGRLPIFLEGDPR